MVAALNIADGVLLYLILNPCRHECPCLEDNTSFVFLDEMKRTVGVCRRHVETNMDILIQYLPLLPFPSRRGNICIPIW